MRLVVLLCIAAVAACGRGGTVPEWRKGDVVTRDSAEDHTETASGTPPGGAEPTVRRTSIVTKAHWLEKCLDADGTGRRTRYRVFVPAWSRTVNDATDESLKGAYVDVTATAAGQLWALAGGGVQPSDAAKKWLDERFGPRRPDDAPTARFLADDARIRQLLLGDRARSAGDSWTPDLAGLLADSGRVAFDPTHATGTVTVVERTDASVHGRLEASLPMLAVPGTKTPFTKGGAVTITLDARLPLDDRVVAVASVDRTAALDGEATVDGTVIALSGRSHETRQTTAGGDFPDPK